MPSTNNTDLITCPTSAGELLDKLSILEIKSEKIIQEDKLINIKNELQVLTKVKNNSINYDSTVSDYFNKLKEINIKLWTIEDDIRDCERNKDFSNTFIQLARAVYKTNDVRAAIKKEINLYLGSNIVEEKSYQDY
jgi:hypothetical protein